MLWLMFDIGSAAWTAIIEDLEVVPASTNGRGYALFRPWMFSLLSGLCRTVQVSRPPFRLDTILSIYRFGRDQHQAFTVYA